MTMTTPSKDAKFDSAIEKKNIDALVTTTTANRLTRALLSATHVYAGVQLSKRYAASVSGQESGMQMAMNLGLEMASLFSLSFIGSMWMSTGVYGQ
jgi:hypothetical protein